MCIRDRCSKSFLLASYICENPPGFQPSQAQAEVWRDFYKLLFSLLPFAFCAPEKLILNEVVFAASIKNAMPGDQSTIFILEICCNHQEIQVSRPNVSCVTQSLAPGKNVGLLCDNVKRHQRPGVLQKCAAWRREGSPGGPGVPQTAQRRREWGSVQRGIRWGRSSQEGRSNGLSFVGGCACAPEDPETPLWSSSPRVGWLRGGESCKMGANFNCSTSGRLNASLPEAPSAEESHSTLLSKQQIPRWGVCNAVSLRAGSQRRLDATCEKRWVGEPTRLAGLLGALRDPLQEREKKKVFAENSGVAISSGPSLVPYCRDSAHPHSRTPCNRGIMPLELI